jgi:hypothetical protein
MKQLFAIVASVFALSAFAQTPAPAATPAPAKVESKKDAKPAKSQAPAVKDQKATVPATK